MHSVCYNIRQTPSLFLHIPIQVCVCLFGSAYIHVHMLLYVPKHITSDLPCGTFVCFHLFLSINGNKVNSFSLQNNIVYKSSVIQSKQTKLHIINVFECASCTELYVISDIPLSRDSCKCDSIFHRWDISCYHFLNYKS